MVSVRKEKASWHRVYLRCPQLLRSFAVEEKHFPGDTLGDIFFGLAGIFIVFH